MFQLDVKNFLYGDLEEIYMEQSLEYVVQEENMVKAIYDQYMILSKVHEPSLICSVYHL